MSHRNPRGHFTNIHLMIMALVLTGCTINGYAGTISVRGTVSTSAQAVRFASVTFVNTDDTTNKYTAVTDTSGNYSVALVTSVRDKDNRPTKFEVEQNYPNPFSTSTVIPYKLKDRFNVSLKIIDITGREVRTIDANSQDAGTHGIIWDGTNNAGIKVAAGVYFYRLQSGHDAQVRKLVFNGRGTTISLAPHSGFVSTRNENRAQISTGSFTVRVANLSGTRPKILYTEIPNIVVQQDTILNFGVEGINSAYSLSYLRLDTLLQPGGGQCLDWVIHLNNITGTSLKVLTHWSCGDNDYDLTRSPDGKYIDFTLYAGDEDLYEYDLADDTLIGLIASDTMMTDMGMWTPNDRIIYQNRNPHDPSYTPYIMDADGSNISRICLFPYYLFLDSYTCLTAEDYSTKIYETNLDCTFKDSVLDLMTIGQNYVHMSDFDPISDKILILADPTPQITNLLVTYNINTKKIDTISIADSGWMYLLDPKYSHDFQKIALEEINYIDTVNYTRRLSILENGSKTVLEEFSGINPYTRIDAAPLAFSPDDRFLAFSKDVGLLSWKSYLYVVDVLTKQTTFIDMGYHPVWNPQKPH